MPVGLLNAERPDQLPAQIPVEMPPNTFLFEPQDARYDVIFALLSLDGPSGNWEGGARQSPHR